MPKTHAVAHVLSTYKTIQVNIMVGVGGGGRAQKTLQKDFSRGWFRSIDLWVMGPARSHCATLLDDSRSIQWNPSKVDTIRTKNFIHCSKVSLAQGLVVDHAPPTIVASYDKALLWTTKRIVLMRDLSTNSS